MHIWNRTWTENVSFTWIWKDLCEESDQMKAVSKKNFTQLVHQDKPNFLGLYMTSHMTQGSWEGKMKWEGSAGKYCITSWKIL